MARGRLTVENAGRQNHSVKVIPNNCLPEIRTRPGYAACLIPTARPGIPCSSSKLTASRSSSENQPGPGTQDGRLCQGGRHPQGKPGQGGHAFGDLTGWAPFSFILTKVLASFPRTFSSSSKGHSLLVLSFPILFSLQSLWFPAYSISSAL